MSNFHKNAKLYIEEGFDVIPLKPMGKKPYDGFKWKSDRIIAETINNFPDNCNIGIILGERSGNLVDLDFDIPEASIIGNFLFKNLPSFGRESFKVGHRIAICPDAEKTKQFQLTEEEANIIFKGRLEKTTVIELRANGGYTMFPPSIHPSGEKVEWLDNTTSNIPEIAWADLLKTTSLCAFLAIVLRVYPEQAGARDNICMALCGALLRADLKPDMVDNIVEHIASLKGDEESHKRGKAVTSAERLNNGEDVSGLPKLCELLGIQVLEDKLNKWLYGTNQSKEAVPPEFLELNKKFFVVDNDGGQCRVAFLEDHFYERGQKRKMLVLQSFGDFKNRYMNRVVICGYDSDNKPKMKKLGHYWLEHPNRAQYDRIVFAPAQKTPDNVYNLWQGFAYKAQKGTWRKMLKHIYVVLANRDPDQFKYIIKWIAWAFQNPDRPAEVAIVFQGKKGTGKGIVCRWIKNCFGQHGLQVFSSAHLTGRFNNHMRDCVLLFADEAVAPNDKDAESTLKGYLTEKTLPIEAKGRDIMQAPNYLHVMMASNSDWVVPASADERRFAVFSVTDEKAQNEKWFKAIEKEMANGGAEAMLYFFLSLKLGEWQPRNDIPQNMALVKQQIESLKGLDKFYFDCLCSGEISNEVAHVSRSGQPRVKTTNLSKLYHTSGIKVADYLKEMGWTSDRSERPSGWIAPDLNKAREIWHKKRFNCIWDKTSEWIIIPDSFQDIPF